MIKKRGLGKSLDAILIGSAAVAEAVPVGEDETGAQNEKLSQLPVYLIQSGKYQPRRAIHSEALEELAQSIRSQGVIQPIIVRHIPDGRYEIVAGERRWRAAQQAGLTEIPAIVRDIPDEAAIAMALIENIQRENLNPIEEAIALQRLLAEFTMTHEQAAQAVGKSRTSVTNLLRLLTLTDEVKDMLEQGKLEMGHARALLTLLPDLQVDAAIEIVQKKLSVRETEALVRRLQLPPAPPALASSSSVNPDLLKMQDNLSQKLKLSVEIKHNKQGVGKFVCHYNNLKELDALLAYFQT